MVFSRSRCPRRTPLTKARFSLGLLDDALPGEAHAIERAGAELDHDVVDLDQPRDASRCLRRQVSSVSERLLLQ